MSANRFIPYLFLLIAVLGVTVPEAFAEGGEHSGHVRVANVLFSLVLLLLAAKIGGNYLNAGTSRRCSANSSSA